MLCCVGLGWAVPPVPSRIQIHPIETAMVSPYEDRPVSRLSTLALVIAHTPLPALPSSFGATLRSSCAADPSPHFLLLPARLPSPWSPWSPPGGIRRQLVLQKCTYPKGTDGTPPAPAKAERPTTMWEQQVLVPHRRFLWCIVDFLDFQGPSSTYAVVLH